MPEDREELREQRRQALKMILENAIKSLEYHSYKDARDYARTASDAIHLEFVQQPD